MKQIKEEPKDDQIPHKTHNVTAMVIKASQGTTTTTNSSNK
jgi:hypothetical protein